jgi:hypothetical protein
MTSPGHIKRHIKAKFKQIQKYRLG